MGKKENNHDSFLDVIRDIGTYDSEKKFQDNLKHFQILIQNKIYNGVSGKSRALHDDQGISYQ